MIPEQRSGPVQRWSVRKRVWGWGEELLWVAYELVDRGPDNPPLWVDRAVSTRWSAVMRFVEVRVRLAWLNADAGAPQEPPWADR